MPGGLGGVWAISQTCRWGRRLTALLLAAVLLAVAGAVPDLVRAQPQPQPAPPIPASAWAPLGPTGPAVMRSVGVSSAWPDDRFLLVAFQGRYDPGTNREVVPSPPAARSFDGGRTWEPLSERPGPGQLAVVQTKAFGRVILNWPDSLSSVESEPRLRRSTDDGMTWNVVPDLPPLRVRPYATSMLVVSPDARRDGQVLLVTGGRLYQSLDVGVTWAVLDPAPGQLIQQAVYSPDFANDRTIFAVATADEYPPSQSRIDNASTISERSVGVVVSRDGGLTWAPSSAGLEADGGSFRLVQALAISPTFARDGTLFAFGWETYAVPAHTLTTAAAIRTALFRSMDRGASWQEIRPPGARSTDPVATIWRTFGTLAMAPDFAESGMLAMTAVSQGISPSSHSCVLRWSHDFGATWQERSEVSSYGGCSGLRFGGGDPRMLVWSASSNGAGGWLVSQDGGASRAQLAPRDLAPGIAAQVVLARDGTLFFAGSSGVLALGPSAVRTDGRLPCQIAEDGAFAAAYAAADRIRPGLGCPTEPPRSVIVRERQTGDDRLLWFEDDSADWLTLGPPDRYSDVLGVVRRTKKTDKPWSEQPDRTDQAQVQQYQGGVIVLIPPVSAGASAPEAGVRIDALVISQRAWQAVRLP